MIVSKTIDGGSIPSVLAMNKYLINSQNNIMLIKYCVDNVGLYKNQIFSYNENQVICEIPDDFLHFWRYVQSGQYQMFLIDNSECDKEAIHNVYKAVFMSSPKTNKDSYYYSVVVGLHGLYVECANKPFNVTYIAPKIGYNEWRDKLGRKWYEQTKIFNYAPYKVNHWYCDIYDYYDMIKPDWSKILW